MLKVVFCVSVAALFLVIQGQVPPGGHHPVDPDDPRLMPAIEFAAASANAACDCKFCQTVINATNATVQVVDGAIFQFSLSLQESDQCLSSQCMGSLPPSSCSASPKAKPYWCYVDLVINAWSVPTHVIRNLTCDFPPKH